MVTEARMQQSLARQAWENRWPGRPVRKVRVRCSCGRVLATLVGDGEIGLWTVRGYSRSQESAGRWAVDPARTIDEEALQNSDLTVREQIAVGQEQDEARLAIQCDRPGNHRPKSAPEWIVTRDRLDPAFRRALQYGAKSISASDYSPLFDADR